MRAKCRRLAAEHGLHLVIIDYVQLMQGRGRFENRTLELASISRSLKGLAKELQRADRPAVSAQPRAPSRAPITGRSSRTCASRALSSRTPTWWSSSTAKTSTPTRTRRRAEHAGIAELIVGKQRNGPTGVVKLAFIREFTRFENLAAPRVIGRAPRL